MKYALTITANFAEGDEEYDIEAESETIEDIGPSAIRAIDDAVGDTEFSSLVIVVVSK